MNLEKFEKMAELILKDLSNSPSSFTINIHPTLHARMRNFINIAQKSLPEHQELFTTINHELDKTHTAFNVDAARSIVRHVLEIVEIEKASKEKIKQMKIFDSADEKLKQANLSFRKEDYTSAFHNLNTALELVLKDKLGIPTTITKINTSNIIDILVKHNVKPHLYLTEARKRVLMIDNKIKHQGYSPSKIDCINGIKAMEELISKLRNKEIKLTEDIRNKIYKGL